MSRFAPLSVFVIAALVAAPASAARAKKPADTTPPSITHTPPGSCPARAAPDAPPPACEVSAVIVDDSAVFDPTLLYRLKGGAAYDRAPMKKTEGDTYVGVVPAAVVAAGDVEYLIEAFDVEGNGPARAGTEAGPLLLKKPALPPPALPPPPPPPPAADDDTGLVVGAVAAGVVVVAAAAVGIGVAVYALRAPAVDVVTVNVDGGTPFSGARP